MENKKISSGGINSGSASLVMVFSVLCLTIFAVLSLVTANNDLKLAKKTALSAQEYYAADLEAVNYANAALDYRINPTEETKKNLDIYIEKYPPLEEDPYSGSTLSYLISINDQNQLNISLSFSEGKMTVLKWLAEEKEISDYDTSLPVWDGFMP